MNDLKPCPFCGEAEDLVLSEPEGFPSYFSIICLEQCQTEGPWEPSEAKAIAAWNKRTPTPRNRTMPRPIVVGQKLAPTPFTVGDLKKAPKKYKGHCFHLDDFGPRIVQWTQTSVGTFRLINLETGNRVFDRDGPDSLFLTPVNVTMTVESVE